MTKKTLSLKWRIFRLAAIVVVAFLGVIVGAKFYQYMAHQHGQEVLAETKTQEAIAKRQDRLLHRSNSSQAIDKENQVRFKNEVDAAHKLVTQEDGKTIVHHKFGQTVMPENPQRIVVIRMEDPMLALDIPFLAGNYNESHYLYKELSAKGVGVISVNDDAKTINYEQVQALHPDLIIMRDSFRQSVYDKLNQIAPTAAFNLRQHGVSLLALSYAMGRGKEGEARLQAFYDRVKFFRMALADHIGQGKVAHLRVLNKEVRLYPYSTNDISRFMYEKLNLNPPQLVLDGDYSTTNNAISLERLPDLDADYLIVSAGYGPSSKENAKLAEAKLEALRQDPVFAMIPAVKEGHVLYVDTGLWNAHGILQEEKAMDDIYEAWGR